MKTRFNSKMSGSPFYVGPSVYVSTGRWSFINKNKKERKNYKFITLASVLMVALIIVFI